MRVRGRKSVYLIALCACLLSVAAATDGGSGLRHNPFDKPTLLAQPAPVERESVEQPVDPPRLKGTLVSADSPMVVLEDTLLLLGEEHQGFRLVEVHEGAAVFEHRGDRVRVEIETQDRQGGRR
ncbi:MAG: hypothetical protein QNJ91_08295 [Gammaproteobacteria bacterium]|nr:hypothetical protein [Gammaproteobacteria bacterium]